MDRRVSPAFACVLFVTTRGAFAQSDPPPESTPPGTPSAAPIPAAPAASAPGSPDPAERGGRFRIGFDVVLGWGTRGESSGPAIGATFRAGYQIDELMAVYGNLRAIAWVAGSTDFGNGTFVDLGTASAYHLNPVFSLTPIDALEIAAGPSLDYTSYGSISVSSAAPAGPGALLFAPGGGTAFGLDGRVALHLGGKNTTTGRRRGFTIGFDVHPTFLSGDTLVFYTLNLGADWY